MFNSDLFTDLVIRLETFGDVINESPMERCCHSVCVSTRMPTDQPPGITEPLIIFSNFHKLNFTLSVAYRASQSAWDSPTLLIMQEPDGRPSRWPYDRHAATVTLRHDIVSVTYGRTSITSAVTSVTFIKSARASPAVTSSHT